MTMTVSVTDAQDRFSELVDHVEFTGERVVITRAGRDAVVLMPVADLAALEAAVARAHSERSSSASE